MEFICINECCRQMFLIISLSCLFNLFTTVMNELLHLHQNPGPSQIKKKSQNICLVASYKTSDFVNCLTSFLQKCNNSGCQFYSHNHISKKHLPSCYITCKCDPFVLTGLEQYQQMVLDLKTGPKTNLLLFLN